MNIPQLSKAEIEDYLNQAKSSERHRALKIYHQPGDEVNRTVNFMMANTYLQPHMHPKETGKEKIERYKILDGKLAIVFFEPGGAVKKSVILDGNSDIFEVHPEEWHTPVVLSEYALCYEEVNGVFNPKTYKEFASWAPIEKDPKMPEYLEFLKKEAVLKA